MANLLEQALIKPPVSKNTATATNTTARVKPLEDKGYLLPSKIFGSPVEYAKDLKQDIVNIGRAAKGNSNDHSLGRINDVAMKLGSLALATYLCVKNPLKLNKAMEFVGFSTFFGSMALWPKLAIQAPIKARTGIDVHQKYIDSQGRKKMLLQDPQYVLTDLFSQEELDKKGDKLGVNKNLPDRNSYTKQRIQKTGVQANTLWMMSAGLASPVMSALACNVAEKPIQKGIEKAELAYTQKVINDGYKGVFSKFKQSVSEKGFNNYLANNYDKVMDSGMIRDIAEKISKQSNSASLQSVIEQELSGLKNNVNIDSSFVKEALENVPNLSGLMGSLTEENQQLLDKAIKSKSFKNISKVIVDASESGASKRTKVKLEKEIVKALEYTKEALETPKVFQVKDRIKELNTSINDFKFGKNIIDRYISARVGDKAGTYIANQWGRFGDKLMGSLGIKGKALKALSNGDMKILTERLEEIAANPQAYDKTVSELLKVIGDYEKTTGSKFKTTVSQKAATVCYDAKENLSKKGFDIVAEHIKSSQNAAGTIENGIKVGMEGRILGAQSSFYRALQSLEVFKQIHDGSLQKRLAEAMKSGTKDEVAPETIEKLTKVCKDIILKATTTDHVEKLKTAGFELSEKEYKAVMQTLFGEESTSKLSKAVTDKFGNVESSTLLKGFQDYKKKFVEKVINWQNDMTPELSRRTIGEATHSANAAERNNLVGKPINKLVHDLAQKKYCSAKWLKIFGGAMIGITAATLIAGLFIGRKSETEKQAELEVKNKVNG